MEQDTGVEPAFTAWEAVVLPIYESCVYLGIVAEQRENFNRFLSYACMGCYAALAMATLRSTPV